MGLLSQGTPLEWEASKKHIQHVKVEGIKQFLHVYNKHKGSRNTVLKWGDEVEYTLMIKDPADGNYKLLADAPGLLAQLEDAEPAGSSTQVVWHPEYSNWQIEGTPAGPYRCYVTDLLLVEPNMKLRRSAVQKLLPPGTICLSVTNTVVMGKPSFLFPPRGTGGPVAMSSFFDDSIINPHPRFATLTANIRRRRGEKVDIRMPLFEDEATAKTDEEAGIDPETGLPHPSIASQIGMDCMAFGMGSCCLQVTLQARDVNEGRILYDQLATLAPIMLALTAATPAWRGRLAATDVRWNVISMSVDDRTPGERGVAALQPGEQRLAKSRYSSISRYIAPRPVAASGATAAATADGKDSATIAPGLDMEMEPEAELEPEPEAEAGEPAAAGATCGPTTAPPHLPEYDDVEAPIHQPTYDTLIKAGIDDVLAHHIAHLYVRDPLVIYNEKLDQDHTKEIDHFENIQSTNWNSMRFKLPPPDTDIGWRVEFRTMELQLTDFENAAFSIFTILISRVIIAFNLNLYVPLSKVDANMDTAHEVDAVLNSKFYFRKHVMKPCEKLHVKLYHSTSPAIRETEVSDDIVQGLGLPEAAKAGADSNAYGLLSIDEIMNGVRTDEDSGVAPGSFPGLLPLIQAYLDIIECTGPTRDVLNCYLDLIRLRASGELATAAHWARNFLTTHPEYKKDAVITDKMHNDLVEAFVGITDGTVVPPELLGRLNRRMQGILAQLQEASPDAEGAAGVVGAGSAGGGAANAADSWDAAANQRWQDILARIQADSSEALLRGASLCD